MTSNFWTCFLILNIGIILHECSGRIHHLALSHDYRRSFDVSVFGLLIGGSLRVQVKHLAYNSGASRVGFSVMRTITDSINPYVDIRSNICPLDQNVGEDLTAFILLLDPPKAVLHCHPNFTSLPLYVQRQPVVEDSGNVSSVVQKRSLSDLVYNDGIWSTCGSAQIPLNVSKVTSRVNARNVYSFEFTIVVDRPEYEGLYSIYFHKCISQQADHVNLGFLNTSVDLVMDIYEKNMDSYLSAGEILLPRVYIFMSFAFFVVGCIWIRELRQKKEEAFKIHYLMGLLVFVKCVSLFLHGVNYYFISKDGTAIEAWAVLYYITHLLKGALLFITIVLIGTGWAFIKHILSDKDKKIFMIVIPLQVLANVAEIIMEESEEGEMIHATWREVFILVDLLCCGAILFPVVWSIRHLQEASHIDGKVAINLEKLKLFRHFYVMIVCYIYFTRIIVYLLKIAVPYKYEWLDEMFREGATLVFFILTGYKFRPASNNPYFRLAQDEDDMEEVLTETGLTEHVKRTVRNRDASSNANKQSNGGDSSTTTTAGDSVNFV